MQYSALGHPHIASILHKQRQRELELEAAGFRAARETKATSNRLERFIMKRRQGKVTWIETITVQRSA